MFAALYLERDPLRLADFLEALKFWIMDVGGFAYAGLVIWVLVRALSPGGWRFGSVPGYDPPTSDPRYSPPPTWVSVLFTWSAIVSIFVYKIYFLTFVPAFREMLATLVGVEVVPGEPVPYKLHKAREWIHVVAAFLMMAAVLVPFVDHLFKLRWRRIWGLSKLAFKEAVRRRVPYVFAAFLLIWLFLNWFVSSKPEEQLQDYVTVVFWGMTFLILLCAGLVSAFSIPNDIRQQTIHTVTTKPVERFELVLGRWIGYMMLMTLIQFVLVTISLFYVLRGVHPDARAQSLKARVPHYGELAFFKVANEDGPGPEERESANPAEQNVGREWDYFKYITGTNVGELNAPRIYAEWTFADVPAGLADRDFVRCEFNFDVYRTNKGKENEGLTCSFFFQTRHYDHPGRGSKAYLAERQKLADRKDDASLIPEKGQRFAKADDELSEKYGYYEAQGVDVTDYHTLYVDVPAGLIRSALKPGAGPALTVRVRCESKDQFVGMARYHLYLRRDNPVGGGDTLAFALNFYKGSLGVWLAVCLVVGLCVFLSVQLGGILSFICAMILYLSGLAREHIVDVVTKRSAGGGPAEGFLRLVRRENLATPLEETTLNKFAERSDDVYRFVLSKFMNMLPDTDRLFFTDRVANGFDVGVVGTDLLPTALMVFGYLLPWAVLAFYLLKSREIAGAH